MTLKQIWLDFAEWTTCHGVGHMVYTAFVALKAFWTIVVLSCAAFFVYQLQSYIAKYISYPFTIQTAVRFDSITFPVVTICLVNPMKYSMAKDYTFLMEYFSNVTMALAGYSANTSSDYPFQGLTDELTIINTAKEYYYSLRGTNFPNNNNTGWYSFDDLFISCIYDGKPCYASDFYKNVAREYGYCYSFNYYGQKPISRAGPDSGLKLVLRSDPKEYLPITETTGFLIRIGEQTTSVYPRTYGHQINVGYKTSVAMTFSSNERLGSPYDTCTPNGSGYLYFYDGTYNVEGCYRSCYQVYVYATCGCYDNRYKKIPNTTYSACTTTTAMSNCANNILSYLVNKWNPITQCNCPYPCADKTFVPVLSQAVWPPYNYVPTECYNATAYTSKYGVNSISQCQSWYASNTASVEVYFQRMYYPQLQATASYPVNSLINDIGGNLGLTLGASVITIIEWIVLGILCLVYCIGRNKLRQLAARDAIKHAEHMKKSKLEEQLEAEQQQKAQMEMAKAAEKAAKKAAAHTLDPVPEVAQPAT